MVQCKICEKNLENNHKHYGTESCSACASFFVRTLAKGVEYDCSKSFICLDGPSPEKPLSCRACRFIKCFESGMSCIELYNSERYYNDLIKSEYYKYSKILYNLFLTSSKKPELLYDYIKNNDNYKLIEEAYKLKDEVDIFPPNLLGWALLMQKNQIKLDDFPKILFWILHKLSLTQLPPYQQEYIKVMQIAAMEKKGFMYEINEKDKLIDFFVIKFQGFLSEK